MKKNIISCLLFVATLTITVTAHADATCMCIGMTTGKECGGSGMGGNFLQIKSVGDAQLKYHLVTLGLITRLNSIGKAYDQATGWFCWTGSLTR